MSSGIGLCLREKQIMDGTKGIKNAGFGILAQLLTIGIGILIPRLVLVNLGSESNGLLSSVGNILSYMALLEAGVGTATLQALYKPCAINDHDSANRIMAATDYFYRRTGTIYLLIVLAITVVYTFAIKTDLPRSVVFVVVLLSGLTGVISYFFQGKFKIFLSAEGKSYVNTNIVTTVHIAASIAKALLLYFGFGVVAVQISGFIFNLIQMLFYIIYMKRHYPWLDMKAKPNFDAISQRNAVLVHQVSGLIFSNTDVLLLTVFVGLKEVSVYSMYAMIYGMVKSLAVVLYESYTYALGQSFNTNRKRFIRMFDAYEVLTMMITFALYCICRVMMNPFLKLYTSGVHDIQYVDTYLPWLFAIFYLLHNGRTSSGTVINIAQKFEETKWRSILESIINVTVSVVCVIRFGIYGVLMGTIAALLYRTNDMIIYASHILERSCLVTYKRWILNIALFFVLSIGIDKFTIPAASYIQLFLSAVVVSFVVISAFILVNAVAERESAKYVYGFVRSIMHSFIKRFCKV